MKNNLIFLLLLAVLPVAGVWGQTEEKKQPEEVKSAGEEFSAKSGTLIEKQFVDIGKVKGLEVRVIKYSDLISGQKVSSLQFEYTVVKSYGSSEKRKSMDADELDGLIKSIKLLQTSVFGTTRETYTEVTFKSRTGFQAGAYYEEKSKSWKPFVQVDPYSNDSTVFLSQDDFGTLLGLVEKAKEKM